MLEVLDDPVAAQARALRLQQAVSERFTVAAMTDAVLDHYSAATCSARKPPDWRAHRSA